MNINLIAKKREAGKAEEVRAMGFIPGVLYGPEIEPISISIDYNTFAKLYSEAGEATLLDFTLEGENKEPVKVLIQDVQYDPVSRRITHIDFRQIRMGVAMHATVELRFTGESPAVKGLGGTLVKAHDHVGINCLPKNLISHIDVDLSVLNTFADMIHVKDLILPEGVVVTDSPDMVIAKVNEPLTEDQLKAMDEKGPKGVEEVAVEKKGKEEAGTEDAAGAKPAAPAKK